MSAPVLPPVSPLQLAAVRIALGALLVARFGGIWWGAALRSEEHTSELQSH